MNFVVRIATNLMKNAGAAKKKGGWTSIAHFIPVQLKDYVFKIVDILWREGCRYCSLAYARGFNKPLFHFIGDSHISAFRGSLDFVICPVGAATAYNLAKNGSTTQAREKLFAKVDGINKYEDYLVIVFGEIDCRIHIFNQFMKKNKQVPMELLMYHAIENYGKVLMELKSSGYRLIVHGIPPASKQENVYNYPFYAPLDVRIWINKEFNQKLKTYCEKEHIPYFNVYPLTKDDKGFILPEYAADEVHLNGKAKGLFRNWFLSLSAHAESGEEAA